MNLTRVVRHSNRILYDSQTNKRVLERENLDSYMLGLRNPTFSESELTKAVSKEAQSRGANAYMLCQQYLKSCTGEYFCSISFYNILKLEDKQQLEFGFDKTKDINEERIAV